MLTSPCNVDPLTSHLYIVELGFSGLQLIRGDHGHCDKQMIANQCQKITPHIDSRPCTYYIT